MDITAAPAASKPLSALPPAWLAAWALPVILSFLLALLFIRVGAMLAGRERRPFAYLAILSVLSLPVLLALAHGFVMRDLVRRPKLWGVLTGAGVSISAIAVLLLTILPIDRNHAYLLAFSRWLWAVASMPEVPVDAFIIAASGAFLGFGIGSIQAAALDGGWALRVRWCVVSILSGLGTFTLVFLCWEAEALSALLNSAADSVFDRGGGWEGVPVLAAWSGGVALAYALPTGLFMWRQLRRSRSLEADLLIARFD